MNLVFFDTEFTDFKNPKIISIGCVSETGEKMFYMELEDSWQTKDCSDFVITDVIPLLSGGKDLRTMKDTAKALLNWVESFEGSVGFVTDAPDYDWEMLISLFHRTNTKMPKNILQYPLLLQEVYPELDGIPVETWFDILKYENPKGYRKHHALDDAMINRIKWHDGYGEVKDLRTGIEFRLSKHPIEKSKLGA